MESRSAALFESVAQALTIATCDPLGQFSWNSSGKGNPSSTFSKRRRGAEETQQAATVFDSSAIPQISIDRYLSRLNTGFRCSDATFVAALIIVDRFFEYDGGRLPLTMRNVHRVFFASLLVAVKYHEDLVYSNSHYGKAGGVPLKEVNRLERVLLSSLDFDLRIHPEQYRLYEAALQGIRPIRGSKCVCPGVPQAHPLPALVSAVPVVAARGTTTDEAGTGHGKSNIANGTLKVPMAYEKRVLSPGRHHSAYWSRNNHGEQQRGKVAIQASGDNRMIECGSWAPVPQRALLGLDMAVVVAAAAGDGAMRYAGHGCLDSEQEFVIHRAQ